MIGKHFPGAAAAAILAIGSIAGFALAQDMPFTSGVSIMTQPSQQRKLAFPQAGIIKDSMVKDGDKVKAGQPLMRQDTDLDLKEAERLRVEAESESRIEAAKADKDVKQIEYDRKAQNPQAYSSIEVDEAKAKLIEAEKSVKVAEEEKLQAKIKFEQQEIRLTKMELKAPADVQGEWTVQHVQTNVGEMADPQSREGVIQLVKNDPLWVEIRGLTTLQVAALKKGDKLQVRYVNDKADQWKEGAISFITPVADAGADRQLVRLELPNAEGRDAGMRMELKLPKGVQDLAPKDEVLSFTK